MDRHRKANAFPDLGTPGDSRLLAAIERRTPGVAGGGINHFFGGTIITPPKKSRRGGRAAIIPPLTIISSRPAYIPEPPTAVADGFARFYVTWGMTNGVLASNWSDCVDVPLSSGGSRFIFLKANLSPIAGPMLGVINCEWDAYTSGQVAAGAVTSPNYGADGTRPNHLFVPIGQIVVTNGVASALNNGAGSISLQEYVSGIRFADQSVKYSQGISILRITY